MDSLIDGLMPLHLRSIMFVHLGLEEGDYLIASSNKEFYKFDQYPGCSSFFPFFLSCVQHECLQPILSESFVEM